ncbi:hypothetical protein [Acidocella sp.]|jgi:hypothetical protein|uniref:hypothetical protein n=1 Tax=Acidocella sp. TaxID=50710 RepID=UPI002F42F3DD
MIRARLLAAFLALLLPATAAAQNQQVPSPVNAPSSMGTRDLYGSTANVQQSNDWGPAPINIMNPTYGALCDGSTNDAAAINAAETAAAAAHTSVYIPGSASGCIVGSAVTIKVPTFGDGIFSTIKTSSTTADVFDVTVQAVVIHDINFGTTATRSAGCYINSQAVNYTTIYNVFLSGWFNGVCLTGTAATTFRLTAANLTTSIAGGSGIVINPTQSAPAYGADIILDSVFITGPSTGSQPTNGILVQGAGDITLRHVSTVDTATGLNVAVPSGNLVQSINVAQSYFDTGATNGVALNPTSTGSIGVAKFDQVWAVTNAGGSSNGFVLFGSGAIGEAVFVNCVGANNGNAGLLVNTTTAKDVQVIGGTYAQNLNGITVAASVTHFYIAGATLGPGAGFTANTNDGLVLTNSNDFFRISDNDLTGNTSAALSVGSLPGTPGQTYWITHNNGVVTQSAAQATLTSAGTTTVITHGLAGTPRIQDIMLSPSSGWGTMGTFFVTAASITSTQFTIGTSANPGAGVLMSWEAHIWGDQ